MFQLERSDIIAYTAIPYAELRRLLDLWRDLAGVSTLPRIDRLDLRWLADLLPRLVLVKVRDGSEFEYIYFGSGSAIPALKGMAGKSLSEFPNSDHAKMASLHYREVVDQRRPVCRHVIGRYGAGPYEYMRVTLPFTTDGTVLDRLLVAIKGIAVPEELTPAANQPLRSIA